MSSKISTMSAGRAGSSKYNVNTNGNQGGGSKKGGLAPTTNKRVTYVLRAIQKRAYSSPDQRKMVYCVNQLGGIGAPTKMFATGADGSCASCSKEATSNNFVILAYRQLLGRGVDQSGLRKYRKQILNDQRGLCVGMSQVVFDLTNSPEGRKYMNKLGSVEAQKHRAIVNEYIKKACTVVPANFSPVQKIFPDDYSQEIVATVNEIFSDPENAAALVYGGNGIFYRDINSQVDEPVAFWADKNQDGVVTKLELAELMTEMGEGDDITDLPNHSHVTAASNFVAMYDKNGDGVITGEDEIPGIADVIAEFDAVENGSNGDGVVTVEEVTALMQGIEEF